MAQTENVQLLKARAVTRHVRISPRKVRLVLDAIRRKRVLDALAILANMKKRAARVVEKTLKSAAANAKQKSMDESRLFVRTAFADGGPSMKRYLPRSMGRADTLLKRSTHLTLILEEGAAKTTSAGIGETEGKSGFKARRSFKKKEAKAAA